MTQMPEGSDLDEVVYPTDWITRNDQLGIQYRQLSPTEYELRSDKYRIIIDEEGFNLYWGSMLAFEKWCKMNDVEAVPREDVL